MTRPASIQGRLLALVIGAVAAVWLVSAVLIWRDAEHELDELLDSHLAQAAALLVAQQAGELEDDDHEVDAPLLHRYASRVTFQVWHEGRLAMRSANAPRAPLAQHLEGFATIDLDGAPWRVFAARGAERDVTVYVAERLGSRASILRGVLRGLLGPMLLALPLLALLSWWAVRRGLAPLRALGAAIAQREPQALQPLAAERAPAELAPLVAELNRLFERIGALLVAERRFTADAAHELRTPIAAIRAQAQVALGAAGDEATRSHALQATLAGCDRAAHLVEQLLTLSRLEADGHAPSGRADLALIAREVLATLAPAALARGQQLELESPDHCPLPGSAPLLAALLRNLADNALRYSPDGARVQVQLEPVATGVHLRIEDSGPGLADAERARLGERFFRVLGSGASGSGLGWSIVRRIAEVHGATVTTARSERLGGLAVELRFPA
ncbi:ATP-binding protein [Piscinibacter defluvii]|uniref:ATP-binding protein n=1 Tax=Piscinibacter defluvii TaxID=1796922 RepID=UPI000FDD99D4|nr:ATP-binding protein [Piscinibacter defluvii]